MPDEDATVEGMHLLLPVGSHMPRARQVLASWLAKEIQEVLKHDERR